MSEVWAFTGKRSSTSDTTPTFPSGVFSTLDIAEEWIKLHGLSGTITLYRLDVGAYEWAVANCYFKPRKPHHGTPEFIGRFAGGDVHYHYESGTRT
jgi:hypothetical protein